MQEVAKCFHEIHRRGHRTAKFKLTTHTRTPERFPHPPVHMPHLGLSFATERGLTSSEAHGWAGRLRGPAGGDSARSSPCSAPCAPCRRLYCTHATDARATLSPARNLLLATSSPSRPTRNGLCSFSIFVKSVEGYKWERGILSSTSTVSIPNWSVHCFTVARTLRSRWSMASR